MTEIENYHLANIVKIVTVKSYQGIWKRDETQDTGPLYDLKAFPDKMFINCKGGKSNFLVENAYREHLTQWTTATISSNGTYQYHIPPPRMNWNGHNFSVVLLSKCIA